MAFGERGEALCHRGLRSCAPGSAGAPGFPTSFSPLVEERIVAFSLGHPGLGPARIAAELRRPKWGTRLEDVTAVAPYNAQVQLLEERLPDIVRVGTADKFQGQEAQVAFYSMTTSSGDDISRNLSFLLSRNRLNVAISRAQCLAYLVASPALLEVDCASIDQMRLANALCRLVEIAS